MTTRSTPLEQMNFEFAPASAVGSESGSTSRRCQHCGNPVEVPGWYGRQELSVLFCSPACRRAWAEATPSFAVNLEGRPGHRGANWELQAQRARRRDGFTCQQCGVTEAQLGRQLDVHHQIPYSRFKSNVEANNLQNLISVCPACHAKLEARLRRELPLFCAP